MEKKYKTEKEGSKWLRIIALKDFSDVKKGDRGGLIRDEFNLSQEGNCWVYGYARVGGFAVVSENAKIYGDALVYQNARIYGDAIVSDNACVSGNARIFGKTKISEIARVYGNAKIYDNACVSGNAWIYGEACIYGNAKVYGDASVYGKTQVLENALVCGHTGVWQKASVSGDVKLYSNAKNYNPTITTSIKNREDYIILATDRGFYGFPNNIKNIAKALSISATIENYVKNIQTIRQLYGEEI